ncbi:MAG: GNAT family N-acetyltransferase [Anaerolineales bacterium]|nr:GNAT family N-acetyltransferase [Anaerolineales bacterium]HMR97916.1 GNAT family N-acetyltransferase [Anaerolineales bacterium]HNQ96317.1 GNAT family N-acetyltransferase [Anaerolineales bacterium]
MPTLLRPATDSDLPTLYQQQLDPEATAMAAFPSRDEEAFYAHTKKIMANELVIFRVIVYDGQVAGSIGSWEMDGKREVGYWIGREFWGKGIATQAVMQLLAIATTRPLFAHVAKHNVGSKRVLEKNGFNVIREDSYTNPAGVLVDEFVLKLG